MELQIKAKTKLILFGSLNLHPLDLSLYDSDKLTCPANGKLITSNMINDGRCDCPEDGFDEPGTAACERGRFYCKNLIGIDVYIPSYKVNDGVCDCCDGSDEYLDPFGVKCPNTCETLKKTHIREIYLEKSKHKKVKTSSFQFLPDLFALIGPNVL